MAAVNSLQFVLVLYRNLANKETAALTERESLQFEKMNPLLWLRNIRNRARPARLKW